MSRVGYTVHRAGAASEGRMDSGRTLLRGRRHLAPRREVVEDVPLCCALCGDQSTSRAVVMSAAGPVCPACETERSLGLVSSRVEGWWVGLAMSTLAASVIAATVLQVAISGVTHAFVAHPALLVWFVLLGLVGAAEGIKALRLGQAQADLLPEAQIERVRRSGLAAVFLGGGATMWGSALWVVGLVI